MDSFLNNCFYYGITDLITDPILLRPYLKAAPLPFTEGELIGVSTYLTGRGAGVFYRLRGGQVIDAKGRSIEARPFGDTREIVNKEPQKAEDAPA